MAIGSIAYWLIGSIA